MVTEVKSRSTILLVDDKPANLTALEAILEPLGQRLVSVESGEEALKQLMQEDDVALILLDVRMPGMDGYETASLIKSRERSRTIPIIFLTGLGVDEAEIFRAYEHGAVDYIRKPVDPAILRSKARVFVDLHERGMALQQQATMLREHQLAALEARNEAQYRSLIDAMPQFVWVLSADGDVQYANESWRRSTGLSRGATNLDVLRRHVHPEDVPVLDRMLRNAIRDGSTIEIQFRLRGREPSYRWHLARGVPYRTEGDRVLGWVVTTTDIDEQKRVEETLQQAEQALRRASEAKDVFLAAASHELRTPLTVAKTQTALALRRLGDAECRRALEKIDRQIGRMVTLVEDLLDVGRIEGGRLDLELEEFDLGELLEETRERMQLLSEAHPITVVAPEGAHVCADRGRFEQVVTNLIGNAIRYSPDGGPIELKLRDGGDEWHLSVQDRGMGIAPDRQEEIFERFGVGHGSKYGGLGLGLSIAQGIIQQHGGRVWVESSGRPGEGSVFHVLLPKRPCAPVGAELT